LRLIRIWEGEWALCRVETGTSPHSQHELVDEAKRYSPDVIDNSSTKRRGSNTVVATHLLYTGVAQAKFSLAGVGIALSHQLANWMNGFDGRVCLLRWKLLSRSLCLMQVYSPYSSALCPEFVEEISDALRWVKINEPTILLGDFNAYTGYDAGVWRG